MLPLATPDLAGTGGAIKVDPDDFRVDELPAYAPSGAGPHCFVHVEKRGRDTREVVRELARVLRVPEREVGFAGQKDRFALTTQWLSVPGVDPAAAGAAAGEGWRVLAAARHGNKLKTGHLHGNRFRIRIRGAGPGGGERARAIAAALAERGLPNFYGPQRFGRGGDNAEVGRLLVTGEAPGDARVRRALRDRNLRRLLVSALQSEVFNRVLAARLADGSWARPEVGDVLGKLPAGGYFVCAEPEVDGPRVSAFECSVTGPMPGPRVRPSPTGEPARREAQALAASGVTLEQLGATGVAEGARRHLRLPVAVAVEPEGDDLVVSFELPPGAYATVVLRELVKSEVTVPET